MLQCIIQRPFEDTIRKIQVCLESRQDAQRRFDAVGVWGNDHVSLSGGIYYISQQCHTTAWLPEMFKKSKLRPDQIRRLEAKIASQDD